MKHHWILLLLALVCENVRANVRTIVPEKMRVMGVDLEITKDAREIIQSNVDQIRGSAKYFNIKLERTAMYFPIIERILQEQQIPLDFKYLVIQESGLISDAISSSNAVGFWQFKKETATELGLRIDAQVDERMNIVSATKGASGYLKRSQNFTKNWIYSLLSYYTGLGGVRSHIDSKFQNTNKIKIDPNTHWYVLKYLAHVVAYRNADYSTINPPFKLAEFTKGGNMTLREVAHNTRTDTELVKEYNKWLRTNRVPTDRVYHTILPISYSGEFAYTDQEVNSTFKNEKVSREAEDQFENKTQRVKQKLGTFTIEIQWNGITAVLATKESSIQSISNFGGIDKKTFLKYNDLKITDKIQEGQIYYLKPKKRKSNIPYHVLAEGESLWEVSQKYGIRLKSLASKNRISTQTALKTGTKLWLKKKRPKNSPLEIIPLESEEINNIIEKEIVIASPEKKIPDTKIDSSFNVFENLTPEETNQSDTLKNDFHVVSSGETLFGISRKYRLTVIDIKAMNSLESDQLLPGQVLRVNKKLDIQSDEEYLLHKVEAGHTLYRISKIYDVDVEELMRLNNMKDYHLKVGDVIVIKKK